MAHSSDNNQNTDYFAQAEWTNPFESNQHSTNPGFSQATKVLRGVDNLSSGEFEDFVFDSNRWHENSWCCPIEGKTFSSPNDPLEEFFFFIREGQFKKVHSLLDDKENASFVNSHNKFGYTPLQWCVFYNRIEMMQLLVDKGADVNKSDISYQDTPLHNAAKLGRIPAIRRLIELGAEKNFLNKAGNTPVKAARNIQTIQALEDSNVAYAARQMDERFFSEEEIMTRETIGRGGYGIVKQVYKKGQRIFSVFKEVNEASQVHKEINIHSRLGSEFIISIRSVRDKNPPFGFEMRQATHGSLFHIIHDEDTPVDIKEHGILFLFDICQGMIHIHEHEILHNDLKSDNVLVTEDFDFSRRVMDFRPIAKITDFGISDTKWFDQQRSKHFLLLQSPEKITRRYELLPFEKKTKSDVYCFGLLMWELLAGEDLLTGFAEVLNLALPTNKNEREEFMEKLAKGIHEQVPKGLRPVIPACDSSDYIALMQDCWAPGVNDRPTFIQIAQRLLQMKEFKFGAVSTNCQCRFCKHKQDIPCDYKDDPRMPCPVCREKTIL